MRRRHARHPQNLASTRAELRDEYRVGAPRSEPDPRPVRDQLYRLRGRGLAARIVAATRYGGGMRPVRDYERTPFSPWLPNSSPMAARRRLWKAAAPRQLEHSMSP